MRLPQDDVELQVFLDGNLQGGSDKINSVWETYRYDVSLPTGFFIRLGRDALNHGQVMLAYDILKQGSRCSPKHLAMDQLFARTLQRCGYYDEARDILERVVAEGHSDDETMGLLGSVYKTIWQEERTSDDVLFKSRETYLQSFLRSNDYYTGINAATLSVRLGEGGLARELAEKILGICSSKNSDDNAWLSATMGEALLLLGRNEEAFEQYRRAKELSGTNYAWVASMRRQLLLLSGAMPLSQELLDLVRNPPVIAFVGHMLDRPHRVPSRFPQESVEKVRKTLQDYLGSNTPAAGFSSAACGGDVLFLECLQDRGIETNVVLPFDRESFFETSVTFAGAEWVKRTETAIERASGVDQMTKGSYNDDDVLFSYANRVLMGKAILKSRLIESEPILLSLWNGEPVAAIGGTSESLGYWISHGRECRVIDPMSLTVSRISDSQSESVRRIHDAKRKQDNPTTRSLISMLFADLVGYSKLEEDQVPIYIDSLLGEIAERLDYLKTGVRFINTWGDALFVVFDSSEHAAEYALSLRDLIQSTDWEKKGLPAEMNIRIGVHAGPVFEVNEPILNRTNFFGSHINQAARIEPVTSPGNVYVSEQFASLIACEHPDTYSCKYVGVVVLPKKFGSFPLYQIEKSVLPDPD